MTRTIATHTADDPVDDVIATLNRDGAAVILNLVAPEFMDSLVAGLDFDESTKVGNEFIGGQDNRSIGAVLHANPELCETLLLNERGLEVADRMLLPEQPMAASSMPSPKHKLQFTTSDDGCEQLQSFATYPRNGPNCHHYRVGASVSLEARNGGAVQVLHREMAIYEPYMRHGPDSRELILNVMWADNDFTAEKRRHAPGPGQLPLAGGTAGQRIRGGPGGHAEGFGALLALQNSAWPRGQLERHQAHGHIPFPGRQLARPGREPVRRLSGGRGRAPVDARPAADGLPVHSISCGWVKGRDGDDLLAEGVSGPLELEDQSRIIEGPYGAQSA